MATNAGREAVLDAVDSPHGGSPEPPAPPCVENATYPSAVRVAGMIWVVLGCLLALDGLMALALLFSVSQGWWPYEGGPQSARAVAGAVLQLGLQVLIGALLLTAGVQSLRGAARDMLIGGIGSLVFALLGSMITAMIVGMRVYPMAEVHASVAVMLLAAGVLALAGRRRYKTWRMSQELRRSDSGHGL